MDSVGHGGNPPEQIFDRASQVPEPEGDRLKLLMERQKKFLGEVLSGQREAGYGTRTEILKEQILSLIAEAVELLEDTPWKKHKKDYGRELTAAEREAAIEEAIDIQHFVFNLFILLGVDAEEVYRLYIAKNDINRERQERGY